LKITHKNTTKAFNARYIIILSVIFIIMFAGQINASSFVVDTIIDPPTQQTGTPCTNAPNDCTLRGAIIDSEFSNSDDDVISFDPSVFATQQTISLTGRYLWVLSNNSGKLTINGLNGVIISGSNLSRVFWVNSGANLTLNGLSVTNGLVNGTTDYRGGAGIVNFGTTTLNNCTVFGNSVATPQNTGGGGIDNATGTLNLINSTVSGNSVVNGYGGGISGGPNSTENIVNSTITNNFVSYCCGGINGDTGQINLRNSIVANNHHNNTNPLFYGDDIFGYVVSQGNNIIGNTNDIISITGNQTGNILNQSPLLAPLGNYGGTTMTHALLSLSPAINPAISNSAPLLDQRGAARVGTADIGSFELNNAANGGTYTALLNARPNTAFNYILTPDNGTFTYSVTSGSLPNGINLSTNFTSNSEKFFFSPASSVALSGTPTETGVFSFAITATNGINSNVTNYRLNILAPTAANVSIGGRVLTPEGKGLRNAVVQITNSNGITRTARTATFGYYRFSDIEAGQLIVLSVTSKRYRFTAQTVDAQEDLDGINFTPVN
jgi:Carboxypeptidase regulatory-like domain